jgi:hypothetical protein
VGCSGACGARDCGCGAAEVADGGELDGGGALAMVVKRRRRRDMKCGRARRKKKSRRAPGRAAEPRRGTGELEQLLAAGGMRGDCERRRRYVAGRGNASRGRASGRRASWRARWCG